MTNRIPLKSSITTAITEPGISQRAQTKPEIMISDYENRLEIVLLDWTNVLHCGTGVKGKETAI